MQKRIQASTCIALDQGTTVGVDETCTVLYVTFIYKSLLYLMNMLDYDSLTTKDELRYRVAYIPSLLEVVGI